MAEQARQRPRALAPGWAIAAAGLVIAVILGWAMMAIGARRLEAAKRVRSDSEGRLLIAVDFAAREAMREAQDSQVAINKNNWGAAGSCLARVNDLVTLMEQVAPESRRSAVADVRAGLSDVQSQVGAQSQDAVQAVNSLVTQLDGLRQQDGG